MEQWAPQRRSGPSSRRIGKPPSCAPTCVSLGCRSNELRPERHPVRGCRSAVTPRTTAVVADRAAAARATFVRCSCLGAPRSRFRRLQGAPLRSPPATEAPRLGPSGSLRRGSEQRPCRTRPFPLCPPVASPRTRPDLERTGRDGNVESVLPGMPERLASRRR